MTALLKMTMWSKSRPLTRFCDTNYDVTMHRHTAIRAVLTTVKVLSGRGTFEGQHNGNIGVIPHESALHVIFSPSKSSPRASRSTRVTFSNHNIWKEFTLTFLFVGTHIGERSLSKSCLFPQNPTTSRRRTKTRGGFVLIYSDFPSSNCRPRSRGPTALLKMTTSI